MPSEELHAQASACASSRGHDNAAQLNQLAQACRALWLATLSLMAAFMHTHGTAHRVLLARRIARNLRTLSEQPEIFDTATRERFVSLSQRWSDRAQQWAAGHDTHAGGLRALQALAARLLAAR